MSHLLTRVLVPIASTDDAVSTCAALRSQLDGGETIRFLHVIEHTKSGLDTASVEQLEAAADEIFEQVWEHLPDLQVELDTVLRYDTDVTDAIFDAAAEFDASAIAFSPREGNRWVRLLTGDVALQLITSNDRPVVVLPDVETGGETGG